MGAGEAVMYADKCVSSTELLVAAGPRAKRPGHGAKWAERISAAPFGV